MLLATYQLDGDFLIPADCFFPPPAVDSACIRLVRREKPLVDEAGHATFVKVVKRGFSQRRKMMLKLLKQDWPSERVRRRSCSRSNDLISASFMR